MMPGDFVILDNLPSADAKLKAHRAIVMKCPFCSLDMATTGVHKIKTDTSIIRKILRALRCPLNSVSVTVSTMIQCPYNSSHRFKIKNGKVIAL